MLFAVKLRRQNSLKFEFYINFHCQAVGSARKVCLAVPFLDQSLSYESIIKHMCPQNVASNMANLSKLALNSRIPKL